MFTFGSPSSYSSPCWPWFSMSTVIESAMKNTWSANVLTAVALVANVLTVVAMIVSGIWVVAEIKSTTLVLANEIQGLRREVGTLSVYVDKLNGTTSDSVGRIISLEEWRRSQEATRREQ